MLITIIAIGLLAGTAWGLWNLQEKIKRLDSLIEQWDDTLAKLRAVESAEDDPEAAKKAILPGHSPLRVIIEITDAVELAKRYHWAGGAGALAPSVLKKAIQGRVLEETQNAMAQQGHEAEVRVIVL